MAFRRRTRRANVTPPLASMGDIAFLLIAFFVLVSTLDKPIDKEYEPPESVDISEIDQVPPVTIIIDKHAKIWFGNEEVQRSAVESALRDAIADKSDAARKVILRVDENITQDVFQTVIDAVAKNSVPIVLAGDNEGPAPTPLYDPATVSGAEAAPAGEL